MTEGIRWSQPGGDITTKQDLIDKLSEGVGMSRPEVQAVVEGFLALVMDTVSDGEKVELRRFGVWKPMTRKGRMLKTPDGRQNIQIPDRQRPVFIPAAEFCARMDEKSGGNSD